MGLRVCSTPGCPTLYEGNNGKCAKHARADDKRRGTAHERGYTGAGHRTFRDSVLAKQPICVLCHKAPSAVADHYPLTRRELLASNANPNDPAHGRGLCALCHNKHTAATSPGGWAST